MRARTHIYERRQRTVNEHDFKLPFKCSCAYLNFIINTFMLYVFVVEIKDLLLLLLYEKKKKINITFIALYYNK